MKQQPDKLFRDKLERYQKAAPASAWDRIAAAQPKKKSSSLWLKAAAALLLVACATAVFLTTREDGQPEQELAANDSAQPVDEALTDAQDANTSTEQLLSDQAEPRPSTGSETPAGKLQPRVAREKKAVTRTREEATQPEQAATDNDIAIRTIEESPVLNTEAPLAAIKTAAATGAPDASASVTLVYSADDVSAYLNKNSDDDATADDKKQSTLKKLLQKANDLKTNQDPFGELRQRKNEILALNFKNDKRGQKTTN